jgi:hypothetical protein
MATASSSEVAELHANSEIKEVQLAKVQADTSYQRQISDVLVDKIADDWDIVASELVLISNRGTRPADGPVKGGLFVVNGQHRCKAAVKLGMELIWARVIDLRKVEDPGSMEAGFRLKTNVRLGDRPLERFKAQLRSGNEESIAIVELLAKFDTEINMVPTIDYGINAISSVEALYRVDEGGLFREICEVVRDSLGNVGGKNMSAPNMKGIAWFIEKHADESDRDRLCEKISGIGIAALDRRARAHQSTMGGALWMNVYRSLVELYNEKMHENNRLEWKTRGSATFSRKVGGQWGTDSTQG